MLAADAFIVDDDSHKTFCCYFWHFIGVQQSAMAYRLEHRSDHLSYKTACDPEKNTNFDNLITEEV